MERPTRFTADQWKQRAMDAERQRDQAELELASVRDALRELLHRLDVALFSMAYPTLEAEAAAVATPVEELPGLSQDAGSLPAPRAATVTTSPAG